MNNSSRKKLIAARLRYLRDAAGLTHSGYELGRACPCAEALVGLADIYQVSLDVLLVRYDLP